MVKVLEEVEENGGIYVGVKFLVLPIKTLIIGDKSFMWKVLKRGKVCTCGEFCWLCKVTARERHLGQPGGCKNCRERGCVYDNDGQLCLHHDMVSQQSLKEEKERLSHLRETIKPHMPLTTRPSWRNVEELREHCWLRAQNASEKTELKKLKHAQLEDWLLLRTGTGCILGQSPSNGVRACDLALVKAEMRSRGMLVHEDESANRDSLTQRLQLEDELVRLESAERDKRFDVARWDILSDPSRHLIDLLHLPMRTNEKIVHMLRLLALQRRGGKTPDGTDVLTSIDVTLRSLGGLSEKWVRIVRPCVNTSR